MVVYLDSRHHPREPPQNPPLMHSPLTCSVSPSYDSVSYWLNPPLYEVFLLASKQQPTAQYPPFHSLTSHVPSVKSTTSGSHPPSRTHSFPFAKDPLTPFPPNPSPPHHPQSNPRMLSLSPLAHSLVWLAGQGCSSVHVASR